MSRHVLAGALALVLAAQGMSMPRADTLVVTPLALDRQAAPGGGRFVLIGDIWIDTLRRVLFSAATSQGRMGIYRVARGQTSRLLATGDAAPSGGRFEFLLEPAGNVQGDIAFIATTVSPAHIGVYLLRDGILSTIALDGDPAPSRRGETFSSFDQVQIDSFGEIVFGAVLAGPDGRGIFRASASGIEAVLVPGDFLGAREVLETLQFRANDAGDVASLVRITDRQLFGPQVYFPVELWLRRQGTSHVLAGEFFTAGNASDIFLNFAVTFNQVAIDPEGGISFYAGTEQRPLGAYFVNRNGGFLQNDRILGMRDPAPLSPGDEFFALGAFGMSPKGLLAFHATTELGPQGGAIFARRNGVMVPVAIAGELRPGSLTDLPAQPWRGFQTLEMNPEGAFIFTELAGIIRPSLFMARFVPAPFSVIDDLRGLIPTLPLTPADAALLLSRLASIERFAADDAGEQARKLALTLQRAIRGKAGGAIPLEAADPLDPLLDDLVIAVSQPRQAPVASRFDSLPIER